MVLPTRLIKYLGTLQMNDKYLKLLLSGRNFSVRVEIKSSLIHCYRDRDEIGEYAFENISFHVYM